MKKDISNKALAGLLIAAIVISLSGTMMVFDKQGSGITGYATEQNGTADINISGVTSIAIPQNNIDFGTSYVVSPNTYCDVSYTSNGSGTIHEPSGCGTWSASGDIQIENDGNQDANITIKAASDVATFIGGTSPAMDYRAENADASSCESGLESSFASLTTSATDFCDVLQYEDTEDTIRLGLKLRIPSDAVGLKSNTITFEAS